MIFYKFRYHKVVYYLYYLFDIQLKCIIKLFIIHINIFIIYVLSCVSIQLNIN
jgi:hypothetical protein